LFESGHFDIAIIFHIESFGGKKEKRKKKHFIKLKNKNEKYKEKSREHFQKKNISKKF